MIKRDPPGKTRRFLLISLLALLVLSLLFILFKFLSDNWPAGWNPKILSVLTTIYELLLFPLLIIPIIMSLAVLLKLAEKLIDRLL
ncbi:MAG: hypothetical protein R2824_25835 [Saprospiraceae bacterium]|nr:hypothetical protein [Lewinella sp.]